MLSRDFKNLIDFDSGVFINQELYKGLVLDKHWTDISKPFNKKLQETIDHVVQIDGCTEELARLRSEPSIVCEWALADHLGDAHWMQRDAGEGPESYSFDVLDPVQGVRVEVKVISAKAKDRWISIYDNSMNPTRPKYVKPKRSVGVVNVGTFLKPESRADVIIIFENESNDKFWLFKPRCVITKKGLLNGLGDIRYGVPGILSQGDGVFLNNQIPDGFSEDIYYHQFTS